MCFMCKIDHLNICVLIEGPIIWIFSIIDHYGHMRFLPKHLVFVSQNSRHACFLHWLIHRMCFISFGAPLECQTFVFAVWLSGVATIKATVFHRNMARSHDILCSGEVLSSFDQFPLNQTKASWKCNEIHRHQQIIWLCSAPRTVRFLQSHIHWK